MSNHVALVDAFKKRRNFVSIFLHLPCSDLTSRKELEKCGRRHEGSVKVKSIAQSLRDSLEGGAQALHLEAASTIPRTA